ncbi:MAG TPA: N-acetylmuramic acid 6-phosphate etherase [Methylomusa anaerophila]|uniref:N-acetylmuramic acid 6-phosphate etherase n=1 Tax=Methylomusa anaerophila TaxID=1930071 RepID=UPI0018D55C5E|nr:N-acetylmuramic acid 6-phosphate etherase [Methylomusa anaerophila]HML88228.1 N-acetylmuramic acid 6-phosphate etherase [Methylomusa anaerophila]
MNLDKLLTEGCNPNTVNIDRQTTLDIVRLINAEDQKVALAVKEVLPQIARAVDWTTDCLQAGGRLFYIGAGTSGRLGILDASECPPTYGTSPEMVQGLIAGGKTAVFRAVEGAEDSLALAADDLKQKHLTNKDIVVGIAASGRTPYVLGGLRYAREVGCKTIAVSSTPEPEIGSVAALSIEILTGPEAITGSTRMKAGTAQKMVLNMLTTATMIKLGKVYGNLMVDVQATNHKLNERAKRIVTLATGCPGEEAEQALIRAEGSAKTAIVMLLAGISADAAHDLLRRTKGRVSEAIDII